MTIKEANNFYKQDEMKYEVATNKEFIKWYNNLIWDGYKPYMTTTNIQELIDKLVIWYEIKYPEKDFQKNEGITYPNFENIESLSKVMTIDELLYRLSNKEASIFKCNYRSGSGGVYHNEELGKDVSCTYIGFDRKMNDDKRPLYYTDVYNFIIDSETGKIINSSSLPDGYDYDNFTILDLYNTLKDVWILNLKNVLKCIKNHEYDILLRNKILELTALKLLYSESTTPEHGYKRARIFISEFNQELNIKLDTSEMDLIMMEDYSKDKEVVELSNDTLNNIVKCRKRMIKELKRSNK